MDALSGASFVHLHVHTEYSVVDGIVRIKPLAQAVAAAGMPAVAVTEQGNLFSAIKFYRAAMEAGVKPIVGVDFVLADDELETPPRMVLLCQDIVGYRNLTRLVTRAYADSQSRGAPALRREWLAAHRDGLIALSGGPSGDVGAALLAGKTAMAESRLGWWMEGFPDRYYLQVQRTGRVADEPFLDAAVELAAAFDTPVVATNDVRFLAADDFEAHEARVCIQEGRTLADPRRTRRYSDQQYLRTPAEMRELFHDLPQALENAVEIARRCNLELPLGESWLPDFPVPDDASVEEHLVAASRDGQRARLEAMPAAPPDVGVYDERLHHELDVITGMGFAGYYLIVADFIRWAREQGIPVGPGRGSGAGSLVAYALGITDLDPIAHELLFERFLNPERVSLPDFDIDFCMDGRDRVIDYVTERYGGEAGHERVAQIITFGTMAARAVVRDVGRVLGHPYGFVDQLAKLIPFELGMTLERALLEEPLQARYAEDEEVRTLVDLARKLEGLVRNAGRHAGGVVIAPTPLTDFTALYCEPGAQGLVTQFDKDDVEGIGLVKFDFLGLRTLTIIDRTVATINAERAGRGEEPLDIAAIPVDDPLGYELIKSGRTTAVFQLESRGMKELIRRLQPDCFDDIVALVALFRPGPLQSGMVDDFVDRKHGRAAVSYPLPQLEPVLSPTYGVILYQEQVMQIAQVLAGYTLGGADILRSAMGKKKPAEMAKQREVFVGGAVARGVDERQASDIFDLMEKFAGYGFNKSHSAAYALISYQTAWLKAHHPAAFMAAVLSADMDNTDKVVTFLDECRSLELEVLPPDINRCYLQFSAEGERTIRYGLGAVKGAGESAISAVIDEREAGGPYADLFDCCRRIDTRKVNRRVLEALIRAGAFDQVAPSRAAAMASLAYALQAAEQHVRDHESGQNDMFGGVTTTTAQDPDRYVDAPEWSEDVRLGGEKETLGIYLTGHPITRYEHELAQITSGRLGELRPAPGETRVVAGMVVSLRTMNSRNGRMAVITLDDRTARLEAVVYAELFQRYRDVLVKDQLLVLEGEVALDDYSGGCSMVVQRIDTLDGARETHLRMLSVRLESDTVSKVISELADTLQPFRRGRTPVCIEYHRDDASVRLPLGETWRVKPTDELLGRLRDLTGGDHVRLEYR